MGGIFTLDCCDEEEATSAINIDRKFLNYEEDDDEESIISDDDNNERLFLSKDSNLRNLLFNIPLDIDSIQVACAINRLLFFYMIIRLINWEIWWRGFGGGPFAMNRCC